MDIDDLAKMSPDAPTRPFSPAPEEDGDGKGKEGRAFDNIWLGRTLGEKRVTKTVPNADRAAHCYVVGSTRTGKTTFLENFINQDFLAGRPCGVIDPHGDLFHWAKDMATICGHEDNAVVIDPTDNETTACFNPLELPEGVEAAQQAKELVLAFEKTYGNSWGERLEAILRNVLIVLIENGLTMAEISPVLKDAALRKKLLRNVKNESCHEYLEGEFDRWPERTRLEWIQSTTNKIDAFLTDKRMRQMFCSPKSSFDLQDIIDNGKLLLVNLSKGELGEQTSNLLGSLLLTKIQIAAMKRGRIRDARQRRPYYLYIDEFQNFATGNFTGIINETGKYNLSLTVANQNLKQLPPELQDAVLSCGLLAIFRVTRFDAERLAKEAFAGVQDEPLPWEECFQLIQSLPQGVCLIKNRRAGGIVLVEAAHGTPPDGARELVEEMFEKMRKQGREPAVIGHNHLRRREDIVKEYRARREQLFEGGKEPEGDDDLYEGREPAYYESVIKRGESNFVEFKESLRLANAVAGKDKIMEHAVAKAISAFMNSDGGTLFIGVRDDGAVMGIEQDCAALKGNTDSFLLHLTNAINSYLGKEFNQYASVSIAPIGGKDICVVEVKTSAMPVFLKNGNKEEFYVRASASSQSMSVREANEYIKTHFSDRI